MNFINIKSVKNSLLVLLVIFLAMGCVDESRAPIVTFDSAGKGAYVKFVDQSGSTLLNLLTQADFDASSYTYSVEFVDGENGARVTSYDLTVTYSGSGETRDLRSYSASDFTAQNTVRGGLGVSNVTITAADVTSPFGLSYSDLSPGDAFDVEGFITTENGTYGFSNSSASVRGGAFQGFFDIAMSANCPSTLEGTYDVTSTLWCGGNTTTTVDIVANGGGNYSFSDWSFGAYGVCYGCCSASGSFSFDEVCTVVTLNDGTDSYGDNWTFTSSIAGDEWTIVWLNDYASGLENGTSVITFPGGVPFTLAP